MGVLDSILLGSRAVLLLGGLLLPGARIMRALGLPRSPATCFASSALALYALVVAFTLIGVPISGVSLATGLGTVTLVAFACARWRPVAAPAGPAAAPWHAPLTRMGPWTPMYVSFAGVALFRLAIEPLAGPDIEFRWSWLAEQMLRHGSLDFYPPRSAADFTRYFWAESIPPGTAALHAWAFACAGAANPAWTAPAVALQLWSVHELLWQLAENAAGLRAARYACLAAATCPLLTWSILLGQETGLTTLSLVGLAWSLSILTRTRTPAWAFAAGMFAALGAAAREYGLVFPLLAAAGLLIMRADRRTWIAFGAVAAVSVVWPLRCAWLTGNPFYSLSFFGRPISPRFIAWIEADASALSAPLRTWAGWGDIARYLTLYAGPAVFGWGALIIFLRREPRRAGIPLVACAALLALWATSVRYTNGGLFYSMRVASPAFALGALAAGCMLAAPDGPRVRAGIAAAMAAFGIAMIAPTLALPQNPWRASWRSWPAFAVSAEQSVPDATLVALLRDGAPGVVLADAPGFQRRFVAAGISVIPLWSPAADWLFDSTTPAAEAVRRWHESGVRHIVLTKWQTNLDFFRTRARWSRPPFVMRPVGETAQTVIFSVTAAP